MTNFLNKEKYLQHTNKIMEKNENADVNKSDTSLLWATYKFLHTNDEYIVDGTVVTMN